MDEYKDIELVCACGEKFYWTKGEQAFMYGLLEDGKITEVVTPRRCKACRIKKKQEREMRDKRSSGADY